jgi:hypothetical protein
MPVAPVRLSIGPAVRTEFPGGARMARSALSRSLPLARRVVCDLLDLASGRPSASVVRTLSLSPLVRARARANPQPSWCAVFLKAHAQVVASTPELRQRFLTFPWRRLVCSRRTAPAVAVERLVLDRPCILPVPVADPHARSLIELDTHLRGLRDCDPGCVPAFRHQLRLGVLPGFLRRLWLSWLLACSGNPAARVLGCGLVVGLADVRLVPPALPVPVLSYGPVAAEGTVEVRLSFDPRAIDPGVAAAALADLERLLLADIVTELRYLEDVEAA